MEHMINALLMGMTIELPVEGYYATLKAAIESKGHKLKWTHEQYSSYVSCRI